MRAFPLCAAVLVVGMLSGPRVSAVAAEPVDYLSQIKPILAQRCYSCHGALKQEGSLRLDTAQFVRQGGDSGAALVAGEPGESLIVERISAEDIGSRMPPEGDALTAEQIALLRQWIAAGAPGPEREEPQQDPRRHWSFQVPKRSEIPKPKNAAWGEHPVDAFVAMEHERLGLVPQPEAPKYVLLRRAYLDLIGLPPTPEELQAFLNDEAPDAYARVVDELLERPEYGERWGRHWMDVWRYSDWYGYRAELRNSARHIWRWRDWIVESLNADKPYDEMVVEMLAADEAKPGDRDALRATGFLARSYFKFNRNTWLEGTIEHTGKAFLGITFNCARCHDHMYDPIRQEQYYQFRAIFEPHQIRTYRLPGEPDLTKDGIPIAYDANLEAVTYLFERGNDKQPVKDNPLGAELPDVLADVPFDVRPVDLPPEVYYPGLRDYVREEMLGAAEQSLQVAKTAVEHATQNLQSARGRVEAYSSAQAQQTAAPGESAQDAAPFVQESFAAARPEVWETGPGQWAYRDGHLSQTQVTTQRCALTTRGNHPADFTATFRFRITGGDKWKSVGLSFDCDGEESLQTVYLSAYANGPKVQFSHTTGGKTAYPPGTGKQLPIELGREHTLRVEARGQWINVWVDGKRELVHQLTVPRRAGSCAVWTFDATADFLQLEVAPLPIDAPLETDGKDVPLSLAGLQSQVGQFEKELRVATLKRDAAQAELESLQARIKADDARYRQGADDAGELARQAAAAERSAAVLQAEASFAQAEAELHAAETDPKSADAAKKKAVDAAKKKVDETRKKLDAAKKLSAEASSDYAPLTEVYPRQSTGRRLALARWIVDPRNPLTARVAVNHIWMRHFDSPLVPSVFDFGLNGRSPTHPELLDWLAVEFRESGWSMKHLHKLLVTSRTYRMDSAPRVAAEENRERDRDNAYLWRMNAKRVEAEVVRDCVLYVAGSLDLQSGGPELDQATGETTFRRSIYYRHAPEKLVQFLEMFNSASTHECYRRAETVVPQQALALVNSRLSLEQARLLARRLEKECSDGSAGVDQERYVERLFVNVLSRAPRDDERKACMRFLGEQSRRLADSSQLTAFTEKVETTVAAASDPAARARENLAHVLINHNEFITCR